MKFCFLVLLTYFEEVSPLLLHLHHDVLQKFMPDYSHSFEDSNRSEFGLGLEFVYLVA
jgi:hypothetical protein